MGMSGGDSANAAFPLAGGCVCLSEGHPRLMHTAAPYDPAEKREGRRHGGQRRGPLCERER